jgi:hypothetical protein
MLKIIGNGQQQVVQQSKEESKTVHDKYWAGSLQFDGIADFAVSEGLQSVGLQRQTGARLTFQGGYSRTGAILT